MANEPTNETTPIEKLIRKAADPLTQEAGDALIALFDLDLAKAKVQKARLLAEVARVDIIIAGIEEGLADVKRRVRGVDYPLPPEKPAAESTPATEPTAEEAK